MLRWGGHPNFFQNRFFDIFAYSEKTQKKKIFETNLSVIGLSRAPRGPKIRKCQIWSKIEKRANFQHFSKIPKKPVLVHNLMPTYQFLGILGQKRPF